MNTHADKTQENKGRSVPAKASQTRSNGEFTFQFADNRSVAVAQIKLQEMANSSPQAKQAAQLQAMVNNNFSLQQQPIQEKKNNTGLPDNLKSGIENLSGYSMNDAKVHRNLDKAAQLNAQARLQNPIQSNASSVVGISDHIIQRKIEIIKEGIRYDTVEDAFKSCRSSLDNDIPDTKLIQVLKIMSARDEKFHNFKNFKYLVEREASMLSDARSNLIDLLCMEYTDLLVAKAYVDSLLDDETDRILTEINKNQSGEGTWAARANESEFQRVATPPDPDKQRLMLRLIKEKIHPFEVMTYMSHMAPNQAKAALGNFETLVTNDLYREKKVEVKGKRDKRDASEFNPEEKFDSTALIGPELAFASADSGKYLTNQGFPKALKEQAQEWWERMKPAWTSALPVPPGWRKKVRDGEENKAISSTDGTGDEPTYVVEYFEGKGDELKFWWQLSMDPGVVEIQAKPVPKTMIESGPVALIYQSIFNRASDLGFVKGVAGGGHLNLDFATGLGGKYELVPKILKATDSILTPLLRMATSASKDYEDPETALIDVGNMSEDPLISTDRVEVKERSKGKWGDRDEDAKDRTGSWEKAVKIERLPKTEHSMKAFRDAHAAWLYLHPTLAQFNKKSSPGAKITGEGGEDEYEDVLHYQAVNIQHLFAEPESRRLEFRFFAAQGNVKDIINGINLIKKIVLIAFKMRE